ncbi:hypothetical protein SPI_05106 [Niveomyces insectorum RCEF 264]|uniref:Transmembrane protein n=1 Tax=Niveomyces insectorum RCEF 264 TaxID=1081102 RepID=A0A167TYL7_9HYPO|nr:hypothetical protein SPI_05106 [Niveomyces insectorum RCEF 264]
MADTTQTYAFPLATYTGSPTDGGGSDVDNVGGASGTSSGQGGTISRGAMIAIIVVVVFVAVFGITSSVLFYLAKKREWKVRETIRRSARKVVTALTPRRSEFPKSVKDRPTTSRGRVRLDDVPPTPRLPVDLEKGLNKSSKPTNMKSKFANLTRK